MHKNKKKVTFSVFLICLMFLYPLFMMTRFKQLASPVVDSLPTTNEIWIIPTLILIKKFFCDSLSTRGFKKITLLLFMLIFTVILFGGGRVDRIDQYLYAIAVFAIPIPLLYICTSKDIRYLNLFLKLFTLICLIYSIGYIFAASYYESISGLLGNTIRSNIIVSSDQYRAKMMLGTTITVANYFTMSLPILFYVYFKNSRNKWSKISLLAISANLIASVLTLSRLGFFTSVLVAIICVMFQRENKSKWWKRFIIVIIAFVGFFFIADKYDIARLFMGFSDSSSTARQDSFKLAIYIFKSYPFIGSGMGKYFVRVYTDNSLIVGQAYGLVDPHNAYALILSEVGIVGFVITALLICCLILRISKIPDRMFRSTGYIVLLATGLSAIGGSHIVNEISYSIVFWVYMSLFYATSFLNEESFNKLISTK